MGGVLITLVCIIVSVVFAVVNGEIRGASLWALYAIWAAIFFEGHYAIPL